MSEWNNWRTANPDEDVRLESADLHHFWLKGAFLGASKVIDYKGTVVETPQLDQVDNLYLDRFNPNRIAAYAGKVFLEGAYLFGADLEGANLIGAYLQGSIMAYANLRDANLRIAYLRGVRARGADLRGANFYFARSLSE